MLWGKQEAHSCGTNSFALCESRESIAVVEGERSADVIDMAMA